MNNNNRMSKIKIDGKDFETYLLDNIYTIRRRFAAKNNVLPEFMYLKPLKENSEEEFESINLVEIMKKKKIEKMNEIIQLNNEYFMMDLLSLFSLWCYVKYNSKIPSPTNTDFFPFNKILEDNNMNIANVDNEIPFFLSTLKKKVENVNNTVNEEIKILKNFEKIVPVKSTKLEVTKVKKEYVYTVNVDSCDFFDSINLSNNIPFASLKDFYKVFKGFKPLTKWIFINDDLNAQDASGRGIYDNEIITLKVSNVKNTPQISEMEIDEDEYNKDPLKEKEKQTKTIHNLKDAIYTNVQITFKSSWDEYIEERTKKERIENKNKQKIKMFQIAKKKEEKEQKEKEEEDKKVKRKNIKNLSEKEQKEKEQKEKEKEERKKKKEEEEEKRKEEEEREKEFERKKIELEHEEMIKQKKKEFKMYIVVDSNVTDKDNDLDNQQILERVLSCFTVPVKLLKSGVEKQVQSEFMIPEQLLDFTIIKDMFFTNQVFNKFLQIDERLSIHRYKKNMYFYFISDNEELKSNYIACSLMQKKIDKVDTKIMAKDPSSLTVGSSYVHLKILRCSNKKKSSKFKEILCKFLGYYNKHRERIVDEYREILDKKTVDKMLEEERKFKEQKRHIRQNALAKDIDPVKFIPGYARICQKRFAPKILKDKEVEKYFGDDVDEDDIDKRKHIMLYPKTEEEGTQLYYSCLDNKIKHVYPGLQQNYLDNKDEYPVFPCCFVTDQSEKEDSPYNLYYGEKNMNFEQLKEFFAEKEQKDTATHVIITQKFIPEARYGVLPKDIIAYLHSIDPKNKYYRKGSYRSVNSVLDILLHARNQDYQDFDIEEKKEQINKVKEQMISLIKDYNIKYLQESYNVDMLQVLRENTYIDPHIFHPLLEHIFDCNILIFCRNTQYPHGVISCPNYNKEYLQYEPDTSKKYVLIYEHLGAESDNAKYPQCELIIRSHDTYNITTFKHGKFTHSISECSLQMYPIKRYPDIKNVFKKYKIKRYGIDESGKTVAIELKHKNKIITALTNPLPNPGIDIPQFVVSLSKFDSFNDYDILKEFSVDEDMKLSTFVKEGILYGYKGSTEFIELYFPVIPIKSKGSDTIYNYPVIEPKNNKIAINKLEIYNKHKQVSKLLVEYFYYLFSIDYNLNKPDEIDENYIKNFVKRNIKIIDDDIDYTFLLENSRIFNVEVLRNKDNKEQFILPVPNKNILNKLVYNLKLKLDREHLKLFNYNNLQYIPSSYTEVEDFKISIENNYNVIKGKYPMLQWIKAQNNNYNVYEYLQLPRVSIYHELLNILEENQKNNLLFLVFVSKWSKPSKNIQNKLYSNKSRKLIFDKYKEQMTIIYIDIDTNKAFSEYFSIKTLPTFVFGKLLHDESIFKILNRIEGDVKMFKNLRMINTVIKEILKVEEEEDELTIILNAIKEDSQLDKEVEKVTEKVVAQLDISAIGLERSTSDTDSKKDVKTQKTKKESVDLDELERLEEEEEKKKKKRIKTIVTKRITEDD